MPTQDRYADTRLGYNSATIRRKPPRDVVSQMNDGLLPPPLTIRNMLRTTTELGDMSKFNPLDYVLSTRPRLQSTRPRSGSFDSSFASALRYNESSSHRHTYTHNNPFRPSRGLRSDSHSVAHSSPSTRYHQCKKSNHDGVTQSMFLQGLANPQSSFREHQSLISLQSHQRSRLSKASSAYHRRCPRPESSRYLPSTMSRSGRAKRPYLVAGTNQMSTTSLPITELDPRPTPSYRYHENHSLPSSLHLPSPVTSFASLSVQGPQPQFPNQNSNSTFQHHLRIPSDIKQGDHKELVTSPSVGSIPRYYDYSESFIEEPFYPAGTKPFILSDSQAKLGVETFARQYPNRIIAGESRIDPAPSPAELPTIHNRRPSKQRDLRCETNVFELESIEIYHKDGKVPFVVGHQQLRTVMPQSGSPKSKACRRIGDLPEGVQEHAQVTSPELDVSPAPAYCSAVLESETRTEVEVIGTQKDTHHTAEYAMGLEDVRTPERITKAFTSPSHGGSTIDSLLEKHIESLGLMPEPESPLDDLTQEDATSSECKEDRGHIGQLAKAANQKDCDSQLQSQRLRRARASSLDGRTVGNPRTLKSITNASRRQSAVSEPDLVSMIWEPVQTSFGPRKPSFGWHTLPSTSREQSQLQAERPSLASGHLADIDTNVCSLASHACSSYSQYDLPTSADDESADYRVVNPRPRRYSETLFGNPPQIQARRRMGLCVGHDMLRSKSHDVLCLTSSSSVTAARRVQSLASIQSAPLHPLHTAPRSTSFHEMESGGICPDHVSLEDRDYQRTDGVFTMPSRWSSIIAAMPLPPSNSQKLNRQVSSKTHHSQRSQRSYRNVVEPLNSSRQQALVPLRLGPVPRLAAPDFGPPLDTSTLNLSIPYAETPSTIRPSPENAQSFFDDSPSHPSRTGFRSRLGLRSLRSMLYGSRAAILPARLDAFDRGSEVANRFGPRQGMGDHSLQIGEEPNTFPIGGNCVRRRKQISRKWKDWWKVKLC